MSKYWVFGTDAAATSGFATETQTSETFVRSPRGIALIDLRQVSCGTAANDADWEIYVDRTKLPMKFIAESLDPTNTGMIKKFATPFRIHPGAMIQFYWSGQAAAAQNYLEVEFEEI